VQATNLTKVIFCASTIGQRHINILRKTLKLFEITNKMMLNDHMMVIYDGREHGGAGGSVVRLVPHVWRDTGSNSTPAAT